MSLVLVRHTRLKVEDGICYGRTDLDVADSFSDEANAVVAQLQACEVLISSPSLRCLKLARKIRQAFGVSPQVDDRIYEMDFGSWEGQRWSDISSDELDEWARDFLHARPHGGESVAMLRQRSLDAIDEFRRSGKQYVVVTHAGVIKAVLADGDKSTDFGFEIDFGGIVQI